MQVQPLSDIRICAETQCCVWEGVETEFLSSCLVLGNLLLNQGFYVSSHYE